MPKPIITFQVLRHVVEAASAYRYAETWFVVSEDPEQGYVITPHHTKPPHHDDTCVYRLDPVHYGPPPQVTAASITSQDDTVDLLDIQVKGGLFPPGPYAADAVFWSVSAVEKFLTPYYASVYGDMGGEIVQALLRVLQPEIPVSERVEGEAVQPFAIAHIPNSEYVGLPTEAGGLAWVPRMFALQGGGAVPVPLPPRAEGAQNSGSPAM